MSKPFSEGSPGQRSTVLKQEERARRIAPQREISYQCRESAEWQMAGTNVDVTTLPKRVSLGALDVNSHAGWRDHGVHANILDTKWSDGEKLVRFGTVNSEARRRPK